MKFFSLLHKILLIFSFFAAFVLSCNPGFGDPTSISLSTSQNWRVNVDNGNLFSNWPLINYNTEAEPDYNEIFMLVQSTPIVPGIYEIIPLEDFYRNTAIGSVDTTFVMQYRNNTENQKFSIVCDTCNLRINSANWTRHHTLCSIMNVASGLCMSGAASISNLTQTNCNVASKWDLFGIASPDQNIVNLNSTKSTTPIKPTTSLLPMITTDIQLSAGELAGIIIGTITVTTLVTLVIGYFFVRRRIQFIKSDSVNVQFYDHN